MQVLFVRERGRAPELRDNFSTITEDLVTNAGQDKVLWRWGSKVDYPIAPRLEINTLTACRLASNKPQVRRLCSAQGIRIPPTFYTADEARAHFMTSSEPLLWRPTSHYAGQNMVVVNSAEGVTQERGYWSLIINKSNEYRVYVLFGRVIGVDEKIVEDRSQLAWNHSQGGQFVVMHWDKWPSVACWFSTKLAVAMGLHFGAFDLIKADSRFYMLEVNTSPAMSSVYKVGLLQRAVRWVESTTTQLGNLPETPVPHNNHLRGYRNYIHNIMLEGG